MKITKSILTKKLHFLCKELNKECGFEVGQWFLDYNASYGGYIIVEMEENGGEYHPLLNMRLKAADMAIALDMALQACPLIDKAVKARGLA